MEHTKTVQKITSELLSALEIEAKIEITEEAEEFKMMLDSSENALLIGKYGNTLSSLEYVISLMAAKALGEYKRIIIEVGGYRQEREAYLLDLAGRLKSEVVSAGGDKKISGLKPWERRLIHMHLAEDADVITESEGEDRERVLVIKKK